MTTLRLTGDYVTQEMIDAAKQLVSALRVKGHNVLAATWLTKQEKKLPLLLLKMPLAYSDGHRACYKVIAETSDVLSDASPDATVISLHDIEVVSADKYANVPKDCLEQVDIGKPLTVVDVANRRIERIADAMRETLEGCRVAHSQPDEHTAVVSVHSEDGRRNVYFVKHRNAAMMVYGFTGAGVYGTGATSLQGLADCHIADFQSRLDAGNKFDWDTDVAVQALADVFADLPPGVQHTFTNYGSWRYLETQVDWDSWVMNDDNAESVFGTDWPEDSRISSPGDVVSKMVIEHQVALQVALAVLAKKE